MYGTINEWNQLRRRIRKGEKSSLRTPEGIPLFEESQTYVPNKAHNTDANDAHMRAHGYNIDNAGGIT